MHPKDWSPHLQLNCFKRILDTINIYFLQSHRYPSSEQTKQITIPLNSQNFRNAGPDLSFFYDIQPQSKQKRRILISFASFRGVWCPGFLSSLVRIPLAATQLLLQNRDPSEALSCQKQMQRRYLCSYGHRWVSPPLIKKRKEKRVVLASFTSVGDHPAQVPTLTSTWSLRRWFKNEDLRGAFCDLASPQSSPVWFK